MYALLAAESEDIINKLFNNIQMADENTSDWIEFYRQKWVIASLNKWDARKIARSVQSNKPRMQTKRPNTAKSVPVKRKQNVQSNNNKKKNKKPLQLIPMLKKIVVKMIIMKKIIIIKRTS
uniref:Uncharacterized protein n=1 Tax=Rhizophagus irregularis (strain DAOM 181602 / DAOM 197198 / MUCL 43194) TaxID=747089 RepID=U9T3W7_RHIID